ncbi:dihydroflavonol reductase [Arabidopsis lyrata subsp. lyrata]|uniref:Flavanone 4-reductase n=1 Tax=Arabidopsis lyrata subsp. lyrata TaxID=81972 RepID=D7MW35_ARALL|nr:dihydroflavonol 4-reductase [Arabidopsis lyrata subsp. lyrata]EFH39247.1 dihydroflavonol reductase [Arabidopsis lyrata subsp. lyrata]|eukprot:XP_002862988.1 dihydroflavonol 4-reductase [Arabidopsis lyrata subsp. lyrata]
MVSQTETVCVTGASGFIGSWLVMRLLERGYFVRATVRDPGNLKKVQHLLDLPNAKTQLTLWKADLSEEGSYDGAITGCDGVFHVATPMDFESKDPENEVIKPTVNGMLGIMKACVKAKTVRRFIFTSSAGTVNVEEHQKSVYDENDWSDLEFIMSKKMTGWMYFVSKTLAEKAAWDYAEEKGLDFISIIPTLVVGPFITTSMPPSLITALSPITRNEAHYSIIRQGQYVHLDDLCNSHIFLYEQETAKGRYICSSHDATILTISKLLRQKYPEYNVPSTYEGVDENLKSIEFSSKKLTDMGFNFKYSLEEMFIESIETCRQKGFLPFSLPYQSISENKGPTKDDNIELKAGDGLTDGMMPCNKIEPGLTGERTDAPMPAEQMCA